MKLVPDSILIRVHPDFYAWLQAAKQAYRLKYSRLVTVPEITRDLANSVPVPTADRLPDVAIDISPLEVKS